MAELTRHSIDGTTAAQWMDTWVRAQAGHTRFGERRGKKKNWREDAHIEMAMKKQRWWQKE